MAGILLALCRALQMEVTFAFDGVLSVSGGDKLMKKKDSIIFTTESGRLSGKEMERMLVYTTMFKQADGLQGSRKEVRVSLKNYLF